MRLFARCPSHYEYLWEWFDELRGERSYLDSGHPAPLTASDIAAWAALAGVCPNAREYRMLKALDRIFLGMARG